MIIIDDATRTIRHQPDGAGKHLSEVQWAILRALERHTGKALGNEQIAAAASVLIGRKIRPESIPSQISKLRSRLNLLEWGLARQIVASVPGGRYQFAARLGMDA